MPLAIQQANERNGSAANLGCNLGQIIVLTLGNRVQNLIVEQVL